MIRISTCETMVAPIIPLPQQMTFGKGVFIIQPETKLLADASSSVTGEFLAKRLRQATGYRVAVSAPAKAVGGSIVLETNGADLKLGAEGYELTVSPEMVVIRAPTQAGLFYGEQTLLQLLPPEIMAAANPAKDHFWSIPRVHIRDEPRFAWRGLMLDVSRHFFAKEEVERIFDVMAFYKLNTFHWHLVDDEGWRIEIKKYPRLTQVGAWRKGTDFGLDPKASTAYRSDGRYGGYYTQQDIRELVHYASALHITIVPEIEMPGHSRDALTAYPQYSCDGGPYSPDPGGGKESGVYCIGNTNTLIFLENVLSEVFKLFPGTFIHVGGDEVCTLAWKNCPKCQELMKEKGFADEHQLQGYLVQQMGKFVNANGKRLMGWSEIRNGGLPKNAALMDWSGGSVASANDGYDVVMCPPACCYLDYYQSTNQSAEPKAIGNFLPLNQVYAFEPVAAEIAPSAKTHILGGQGNLWTEFVPNLKHAEYMIFPRECAMSEVLWSSRESRDWKAFSQRLKGNERFLDEMGVTYRP